MNKKAFILLAVCAVFLLEGCKKENDTVTLSREAYESLLSQAQTAQAAQTESAGSELYTEQPSGIPLTETFTGNEAETLLTETQGGDHTEADPDTEPVSKQAEALFTACTTVDSLVRAALDSGYTVTFYNRTNVSQKEPAQGIPMETLMQDPIYSDEKMREYFRIQQVCHFDHKQKTMDADYCGETTADVYSPSDSPLTTAEKESLKSQLDDKLETVTAWEHFESYGRLQYPYGFKRHPFSIIAEEPYDEDTWFLQAKVSITNMYGSSYDTVAECRITGTTKDPVIVFFKVY